MGLSDGRKSFPIGLAVLIQYRSVTDTQPPSHVAVAITLNALAKASSLKSCQMELKCSKSFDRKETVAIITVDIVNKHLAESHNN